MWICPQCRTDVENALEQCWYCGTWQDGTIDKSFQHADTYEPPIPERSEQFSLWQLSAGITALAAIMAMIDSDNLLTVFVGMAAVVWVSTHLFSWLLTGRVGQWLREHRDRREQRD